MIENFSGNHAKERKIRVGGGRRRDGELYHMKEEAGAESECKSHHRHRRLCL